MKDRSEPLFLFLFLPLSQQMIGRHCPERPWTMYQIVGLSVKAGKGQRFDKLMAERGWPLGSKITRLMDRGSVTKGAQNAGVTSAITGVPEGPEKAVSRSRDYTDYVDPTPDLNPAGSKKGGGDPARRSFPQFRNEGAIRPALPQPHRIDNWGARCHADPPPDSQIELHGKVKLYMSTAQYRVPCRVD